MHGNLLKQPKVKHVQSRSFQDVRAAAAKASNVVWRNRKRGSVEVALHGTLALGKITVSQAIRSAAKGIRIRGIGAREIRREVSPVFPLVVAADTPAADGIVGHGGNGAPKALALSERKIIEEADDSAERRNASAHGAIASAIEGVFIADEAVTIADKVVADAFGPRQVSLIVQALAEVSLGLDIRSAVVVRASIVSVVDRPKERIGDAGVLHLERRSVRWYGVQVVPEDGVPRHRGQDRRGEPHTQDFLFHREVCLHAVGRPQIGIHTAGLESARARLDAAARKRIRKAEEGRPVAKGVRKALVV